MLGHLYLNGFSNILEQLTPNFRVFADNYFNHNTTPASHDAFFQRFTLVWSDLLNRRQYFHAIKLWNFALSLAFDWENRNRGIRRKIHKGTPYYFLGVTAILNNEIENGFLTMHQALNEDYRLAGRRNPQTPAYFFVTLDSTRPQQFFATKVNQLAVYLSEKLDNYCRNVNSSLHLPDFRRKFLLQKKFRDEVFFFIYLLFILRKIEIETSKDYKKNNFSSLLHGRILFDLCRVSDRVIEYKNRQENRIPQTQFLSFKREIVYIASKGITALALTNSNLTHINNEFNRDFSGTLYDLIKGRFTLQPTRTPSIIERDFAISYGIRNFGAHKIKNYPVLYHRLPELSQSIFDTLFTAIENLY